MKTALRWILLGFGLFLVLAVAGIGFVQTSTGKAWLARALTAALSTADRRVEISAIQGAVPFDLRIPEIRLVDQRGTWLTIEDATLDIAPRDLIAGQVTIRRANAREIVLERVPEPGAHAGPSSRRSTFQIPDLPVDIDLQQLGIGRIHLVAAVLGEAATATLSGNARLTHRVIQAQLVLRRLDQNGHAELAVDFEDSEAFNLKLAVTEPSGVLLQRLLGRTDRVPLAIALDGSGPVTRWRATATAHAGDLAHIEAAAALDYDEAFRLKINGRAAVGGLVPANVKALLDRPVTIAATTTFDGPTIAVEHLAIDAPDVRIEGHGQLNRAADSVTATATITAPDLAPVAAALEAELAGTGEIQVALRGSTTAPNAQIDAQIAQLRLGGFSAGHAVARFEIAPAAASWAVAGNGTFFDLAGLDARIDAALPAQVGWRLETVVEAVDGRVDLRNLSIEGEGLSLAANGRGNIGAAPGFDIALRLDADLSQFEQAMPLALRGALHLDADLQGNTTRLQGRVRGHASDLSTGLPALDAMIGGRLELAVHGHGDGGAIRLDAVNVTGAGASLSGQAAIPMAGSQIDAQLQVDLPTFAPLDAALEMELAGAAVLVADISGPLGEPGLTVSFEASELVVGAARLEELRVQASVADLLKPAGELTATFRAGALHGTAAAEFARNGATLAVPTLRVSANESTIDANLEMSMETFIVAGKVTARAPDLSPWSDLAGVSLGGRGELQMTLGSGGGQTADLNARLSNLAIGPGNRASVETVQLTARVADLRGTPSGRANMDARAVIAGDMHAERMHLDLHSSNPGVFSAGVEANGVVSTASKVAPFRLGASGNLSLQDQSTRLRIERLAGRIGEHDFRLQRTLTISRGKSELGFDDLALALGSGEVAGSGHHVGDQLDLRVMVRNVPVEIAEAFTPVRDIGGQLSAELKVGGTVGRPTGRLQANIHPLRLAPPRADLPPLGVTMEAIWREARIDFTGRVEGPAGSMIDVMGTAPFVLSDAPFSIQIPRQETVRFAVRGSGLLESWADALPLGEDRLAGRFEIDAEVGGIVAAPKAGGRLSVREGRYVNFAAGTELRDIDLELSGDHTRFVVRRLTATDGERGRLTASGHLDLAAAAGPTVDLGASFTSFLVARRDEATATADGDLRLAGTLGAPTLAANVRIVRAEIRIPDRLPAHVAQLEVIEIDSRRGAVLSAPPPEPEDLALALDVTVDMPNRVFVRGRSLDSEWKGQLAIKGRAAAPHVTGSLEVVRGDFSLLGKRFTLERGTLAFDGGDKVDPRLDVLATHKAAEITAQAAIGGTPSDPTLRLTSTPELPQDEILARVLFGRSVGQITPMQGLQLAQAAAALRGGGPGLLDRLRRATGLDRLEITSGAENGGTDGSGPRVSAGKYVGERVFLGVEQGAAPGSTRTKVEIEITPNVTVESGVGTNSSGGIGLNWKWDY